MKDVFFLGSDDNGGGEQMRDAKAATSSRATIPPGNACTAGRVRATNGYGDGVVVVAALAHRRRKRGSALERSKRRSRGFLNETQHTMTDGRKRNETNVTDERRTRHRTNTHTQQTNYR